jgi:hypothetical protein
VMLLSETGLSESLSRLVDSIIPVVSSILWILAIRLINKWLPKGPNNSDDDDDDEQRPDLPMK